METCYKLLPGSLVRALPMQGRRFEIEPEITACILRAGYRILRCLLAISHAKTRSCSPGKMAGLPWHACAPSFHQTMSFTDVGLGPVYMPDPTGARREEVAEPSGSIW